MPEMDAPFKMPTEACNYALLQRTEFIEFTQSQWWRIAQHIDFTGSLYSALVKREAKLRSSAISHQYTKGMISLFYEI